jgi:predicted nuclease of predicted toxin-antitoxin system
MPIRLHFDECVHHAVPDALRRRGIDVTRADEVELLGASDEEHLSFARRAVRVLVTHDTDFIRLHARGVPHSGIAFCHNQTRSTGEMIRALELLWLTRTPDEMVGEIEFL